MFPVFFIPLPPHIRTARNRVNGDDNVTFACCLNGADLVESTRSEETLLLSAAALANMTGLEPDATWAALNADTAGTLVEAVRRRGAGSSVFLREQTAAVLANMAIVPEARPRMAADHAVVALLCFLQVRHSPLQRVPEILAAERLQHKTAIALSR